MNGALLYLWLTLLRRRGLHWCRALRRPTTLLGFAAVAGFLGFLFRYRQHELFARLMRREVLLGGAMVMAGGSLFKGFLQRGLIFAPPDIEFLFTSPFTQRQLIFYRLLPNYLFALAQGLVFLGLFAPHLKHPWLSAACLTLFQAACFHAATGGAVYGGTLSEVMHYRVRWMMLGLYFFCAVLYLRWAWDLKLLPAWLASPLAQLFFYPALTWTELGATPWLRDWAMRPGRFHLLFSATFWQPALYLAGFLAAAAASLWLLLKLKADIFETSLATTTRTAEKRLRIRQGRRITVAEENPSRSVRLPKLALFRGVGAIVWKNLVVARRSKRELILASVFTLIYTGLLLGLLKVYHDFIANGGGALSRDVADFNRGVAMLMAALAFFLQWTFSFDFRRDGHHLVNFRTLPISPLALALAEVATPTAFCLGFQTLGLAVLMMYARFDWASVLALLFAYPAIALALNGVWNLHYLLSATRRAGARAQSASTVGTLMVVALSFLIFYPAGQTGAWVGQHCDGRLAIPLAFGSGLAVQYFVDFLLLLALARLFQHFEVSRDCA